ncbi:hypothetical protein P3W24_14045 [Luteibacter sp. PPL201]|uniref:Lipoprotein n=1 Tax=Luteibacter sahnii TaxID=3021977 RepID=A0ABT6BDA0_9GAMM
MHYPLTGLKIDNRLAGFLKLCIFSLAVGASLAGCSDDSAVVWQKDLRFPDGSSVVVARTTQYSGPGTAAVFTTVEIARADGERKPVEILVFEVPNETKPATITVDMSWIDATHLDIAYPKNAKLNFRADIYGKINIRSHPRQ